VPELRNHPRIRDGRFRNTLYCDETYCLDKLNRWGCQGVSDLPSSSRTAEHSGSTHEHGSGAAYPGTPRWVKIGAIVAVTVVLLVVLAMVLLGGEHGPMRHMPSGNAPIYQSQLAVSLWLA
jgi:hypothetical protein